MRNIRIFTAIALAFSLCIISSFSAAAAELKPLETDECTWTLTEEDGWMCTDAGGEPVTGWVLRDGDTYFLDRDGYVRTGWIKFKGTWYFLDEETGVLARDTWIDNYKVDSDGACIKIK